MLLVLHMYRIVQFIDRRGRWSGADFSKIKNGVIECHEALWLIFCW